MADGALQGAKDVFEEVKPRLRGWLHAGIFPVVLVSGTVLIALAPGAAARRPATVFVVASVLLFATSALYHRGRWGPKALSVWKRLDHANIYLVIAGSYTPFAVLALDRPASTIILSVVWAGALGGILFRLFWLEAPRWLYTGLYLATGWAAIFVIPQLVDAAGAAAVTLVILGGILYTLGGVVYATKWPDPAPKWFGF
ncbi:MAG: hemolysin III family protein, partial [Actinobacteria bacterium]|nr:hemolysin III family protein [Actinomycetota bacterium]